MVNLVFNNKINGKLLPKYYVSNFDTPPNNSNMCIMAGGRVDPEGKPSEIGGNNCCVIHYGNSNYEGQLAFGFGKNAIARRNKNGSAEWSPWDYVALKSDLTNVMKPMGTAGINANSVKSMGFYDVAQHTSENYPTTDGNGMLAVFSISDNFIVQIFFNYNGQTWCRTRWYGTWHNWRAF